MRRMTSDSTSVDIFKAVIGPSKTEVVLKHASKRVTIFNNSSTQAVKIGFEDFAFDVDRFVVLGAGKNFSVESDLQTFYAIPADAVGTVELSVVATSSCETCCSSANQDPSVLPLTGWWRDFASFSEGDWRGSVSTSTSSEHPLLGSAGVVRSLNGHGSAYLTEASTKATSTQISDFVSPTKFSMWALVNVKELTNSWLFVLQDADQYVFLGKGNSAHDAGIYVWKESINDYVKATQQVTLNEWCLWQAKASDGSLSFRINDNAWTTVSCAGIEDVTANLEALLSDNPSLPLRAEVAEIGISKAAFSTERFDEIRKYCSKRYNVEV